MAVLPADEIDRRLAEMVGWTLVEGELTKTFTHDGFRGSIAFVGRVADLAERANHHPDITIRWNKVTLALSTHSEGGITEKDFDLALGADAAHS